jgi:signal transduction histidine kinase
VRRAWLPALCGALQIVSIGTGRTATPSAAVGGLFVALGLAGGLSLLWRSRFPFQVLGLCAVGYAAQALLVAPAVPAATAVMSFELVRRPHAGGAGSARHTRTVLSALAAALVVCGGAVAATGQPGLVAPVALVLVTAAAAGLLLASHDVREESRRRELLAEQRLRIARDLHDVVGHGVGAISVQAGAARMALAAGVPGDAATAVRDIETASRELLREVRWVVGLLREEAELPGLAEVDGLLDSARRSGLDLHVLRTGASDGVPVEVGHAAYRILQEALTNVLRHGEGQRADVALDVGAAVRLTVCNPSRDGVPAEPGHGLVGMRERAAEVGGTVSTGPEPDGTWVVRADLPLRVSR